MLWIPDPWTKIWNETNLQAGRGNGKQNILPFTLVGQTLRQDLASLRHLWLSKSFSLREINGQQDHQEMDVEPTIQISCNIYISGERKSWVNKSISWGSWKFKAGSRQVWGDPAPVFTIMDPQLILNPSRLLSSSCFSFSLVWAVPATQSRWPLCWAGQSSAWPGRSHISQTSEPQRSEACLRRRRSWKTLEAVLPLDVEGSWQPPPSWLRA